MSRWVCLLLATPLLAQDTHCPAYPSAARTAVEASLRRDTNFSRYHLSRSQSVPHAITVPPSNNFIDGSVFALMLRDGVSPAPLTTDGEFLRRVYLDLTGRIPTLDQAQSFLASTAPDRRSRLVETLLASPAYIDQFSYWFHQRFQLNRLGGGFISYDERNHFYDFGRQFVGTDSPYDAFVRSVLTASGDSAVEPAIELLDRYHVNNAPLQDTWDAYTNLATTQFLGVQTQCISCHDGRGHLENINLYLAAHPRRDFWSLSAFFARVRFQIVTDDDSQFRPRLIFSDSPIGLYNGAINPANPGAKPPRTGANQSAVYWFTNQQPANDNWRQEFSRILTSDRQFARASVNWIWSYFFASGIVDPPDGWDLLRVDPDNPPPDGSPLQNANPALLEALTDRFIQSNYSLKAMVRLIVNSNAYQLSSRYPAGAWNNAFAAYFARHEARRLSAEQLVDSLMTATATPANLFVYGMPGVILNYANQLPEPNSSPTLESLLTSLGRGDWINQLPSNKPSLYGVLDFFNSWTSEVRTRAFSDSNAPQSNLSNWVAAGLSDSDIIQRMFLATLTRPPTSAETQSILAEKPKFTDRRLWLSSVQWALVQKIDFVFNY